MVPGNPGSPGRRGEGESPLYARVAVPLPLHTHFHYRVASRHRPHLAPGVRVLVEFGGRRLVGFVLGTDLEPGADPAKVKELLEVIDPSPRIDAHGLALARWISGYYHHPLGEVLPLFLPPSARGTGKVLYRPTGSAPARPLDSEAELLLERIVGKGALQVGEGDSPPSWTLDLLFEAGCVERLWPETPVSKGRVTHLATRAPGAPDPATLGAGRRVQAKLLEALTHGPRTSEELRPLGVTLETLRRARENGWITLEEVARLPGDGASFGYGGEAVEEPTPAQAGALERIGEALGAGRFAPHLLIGVTGSGKTEVYLRAAAQALERGLGVLVLVPEIGLTPQLLGRFGARLGRRLAVLHSGLTGVERGLQWEAARTGEALVVVGTRSAVFAPVENLGLIIIDEEHEGSFKQEEGLRYNAKHVALVRARMRSIPIVLGSATPDVESYHHALKGRYARLDLPERVGGAQRPRIRLVDITGEEARRGRRVLVGEELRKAVEAAMGRGEQALIYINRRGFAPALYCTSCGDSFHCPNCSVPMTLHRHGKGGRLACHYCGVTRRAPESCPKCSSPSLIELGAGTQKIEELVAGEWPGARVVRLDRDTAAKGDVRGLLASFAQGEGDILVGTQMVAKGHHFPKLTLVGVVNADDGLHLPDYRSGERTFQTLTQVAGRAGRTAERPGTVLIQTRNRNHPVLKAVEAGDYESFAASELAERLDARFPPFAKLALVRVSSTREDDALAASREVAQVIAQMAGGRGVEILGPAPSPIERMKKWHRHQLLLRFRARDNAASQAFLDEVESLLARRRSSLLRLTLDVDPCTMI